MRKFVGQEYVTGYGNENVCAGKKHFFLLWLHENFQVKSEVLLKHL